MIKAILTGAGHPRESTQGQFRVRFCLQVLGEDYWILVVTSIWVGLQVLYEDFPTIGWVSMYLLKTQRVFGYLKTQFNIDWYGHSVSH